MNNSPSQPVSLPTPKFRLPSDSGNSTTPASSNFGFIRPATLTDTDLLAALQSHNLRSSLENELKTEIALSGDNSPVNDELLNAELASFLTQISPLAISQKWQIELQSPPPRTVALVTFPTPNQSDYLAGQNTSPLLGFGAGAAVEKTFELTSFEIANQVTRQGHGSRLLAALVDYAQQFGCQRLQTWLLGSDLAKIRFFSSCGLAPTGARAELQTASYKLQLHCWAARF